MSDIITTHSSDAAGISWRYLQDQPFDPIMFDEHRLAAAGQVAGTAAAGRGNTFYLNFHGQQLVLRHYRRGGIPRWFSPDRFLYTGLERTRPMREFDVLVQLQAQQLAAPAPVACQVVRRGPWYTASLVTRKIDGMTLAETLRHCETAIPSSASACVAGLSLTSLSVASLPLTTWISIGRTIASLHVAGIWHADLNAHNIMLNVWAAQPATVSVIDFDRARSRPPPEGDPAGGWRLANIHRLERSLRKVCGHQESYAAGFLSLINEWDRCLRENLTPAD